MGGAMDKLSVCHEREREGEKGEVFGVKEISIQSPVY